MDFTRKVKSNTYHNYTIYNHPSISTWGGDLMNFACSEKVKALQKQLNDFKDRFIYPNEPISLSHEQATWL